MEDALALQGRLRRQDYEEVWAAHGHDPNEVLVACALCSKMLWCAEIGGTVAAVFGVAPSPDVAEEGQPWLLGSADIVTVPRAFFRWPAAVIPLMHTMYPVLRNMVDARNSRSIKWLARMGFTLAQDTVPYGPFGMPFYAFYKEEEQCAQ
ncbi:hypothetical protein [Halodesulfovibrio spirochaetisodalis]|uniref:DUF2833 domain-containing protein n=1 Tax=Halodesulfovibrio spirochaetisodalis TaxID=1560234 RepID=A0A1B7XEY2_9BACT|nr:hypothetical protein [Halodesulfovibrio spirochaetisodalis]OBQ52737.1 hypothetical protein SP90_07220 [Halodesulfovibrio spirochaetisodalis]